MEMKGSSELLIQGMQKLGKSVESHFSPNLSIIIYCCWDVDMQLNNNWSLGASNSMETTPDIHIFPVPGLHRGSSLDCKLQTGVSLTLSMSVSIHTKQESSKTKSKGHAGGPHVHGTHIPDF
jgi:hypothetical protein